MPLWRESIEGFEPECEESGEKVLSFTQLPGAASLERRASRAVEGDPPRALA
jgi:hypothetical protein